jgi:23S rRNA (cytosine1962-C5)-methyltransferase
MPLLNVSTQKPIHLQLCRDLIRSVKRGHSWIYRDALRNSPKTKPGVSAVLLDNRGGREIGRGYYDPEGKIALRICSTKRGESLNDCWAGDRMLQALLLRKRLFDDNTTAYRLFNGEGDGLPGLVCDRYAKAAVLQLDGEAAGAFWNAAGIAQWLTEKLELELVVERVQSRMRKSRYPLEAGSNSDGVLFGSRPEEPVEFMENGIHFTADLLHGQKTGFYLDQRENRLRVLNYVKEKRVLNVFGYTGGFSVYAGLGGAEHVTTVDTAQPALDAADYHWTLNGLQVERHTPVCADAFAFLEAARNDRKIWDVVILDPPSFAPSRDALPDALAAYRKLFSAGVMVVNTGGFLAVSSCSSHVTLNDFLIACQEGVAKARKKATTLGIYSQPADHPAPLVMPEFRYLKFAIMRIDD